VKPQGVQGAGGEPLNEIAKYVAAVVALLTLAACGDAADPGSEPEVLVTDSAGVRIVTNPATSPELGWTVSESPLVSIGGSNAAEESQLFRVRGAVRLSDGRIVVANSGSHELRYFSADGAFLSATGREGEGPGEFQGIWLVHLLGGDTLLVYDQRNRRTSVFDPQGRFLRTIEPERTTDVQFSSVIDFFADGSTLSQGFVQTGDSPPEGLQRFGSNVYHFSATGELQAELGLYRSSETYFVPIDGGGFSFWDPVFGRSSYRVAAGDRFVYADNEAFDIQVSDPDGMLRMRIRRSGEAPRVDRGHVEAFASQRLGEMGDDNAAREFERIMTEIPIPERFPAHGRILEDALGLLWVEVYRLPGDETMAWDVVGTDGVILGRVTFPEVLDLVFEIGEDYILGLLRDELDVETVRMYGLMRG
jgi:hypothetical protein